MCIVDTRFNIYNLFKKHKKIFFSFEKKILELTFIEIMAELAS